MTPFQFIKQISPRRDDGSRPCDAAVLAWLARMGVHIAPQHVDAAVATHGNTLRAACRLAKAHGMAMVRKAKAGDVAVVRVPGAGHVMALVNGVADGEPICAVQGDDGSAMLARWKVVAAWRP